MHTNEPWEFDQYGNVKKDGETIRTIGFALSSCNTSVANARRIVACVNACEGIDTDTLEVTHGLDAIYNHIQKQRDVMREALNLISDGEVMEGSFTHADTILTYQKIAREAISKAEGLTR